MGIRGLGGFLSEMASEGIRCQDIKSFLGQTIAIDASLSLYQFIIAIRDIDGYATLTNEAGTETSHISGFISRCIRLLENGIKPIYVFDGRPTDLKLTELSKRKERRCQAEADLQAAREAGDMDAVRKFAGRTVHITQQHNDDVKELLELLGVPTINAPTEAEAQCAALAASGLVYATATEDTDALTFGSPIVIRHLNVSDQKNKAKPILVFSLKTILEKLELNMAQFVDFCILCGCDYCDRLKGIGPQTAYKLIKKHSTIEDVLKSLGKTTDELEDYRFKEARSFFASPEILDPKSVPPLIWRSPQEDKLREFLVERHNFNIKRVDNYIARLNEARGKSSQRRLDSFFGPAIVKQPSVKDQCKSGSILQSKRKPITHMTTKDKKKRMKKQ